MKGHRKDFPKEIEIIDGVFYKIKFKKNLQLRGKPLWGLTLGEPFREIQISTGHPNPFERLKTFAHELLHAAEFEYGFKIDHNLIELLEEPLAHIISRNTGIKWTEWKSID